MLRGRFLLRLRKIHWTSDLKAIELAQTLGRPLTSNEYEALKIKKTAKAKKLVTLR